MKLVLVALILLGLFVYGCAPAKIYTFKKDRVDQDMSGNRGYAGSPPPPAAARETVPQRTLIGLDFEIELLPSEKKRLEELGTKERLPEAQMETTRQIFPPAEKEQTK